MMGLRQVTSIRLFGEGVSWGGMGGRGRERPTSRVVDY